MKRGLLRITRWIGWWLHKKIVYPNYKASLEPTWLQEWEKKQADKMLALRAQVQRKRNDAFSESGYGSREKKMQMQAMVDAYDIVLNLIKGL